MVAAPVPAAPVPQPIAAPPAPVKAPAVAPVPQLPAEEPEFEEPPPADEELAPPPPRGRQSGKSARSAAPSTGGGGKLIKVGFFLLLPYALVMTGLAAYGLFFKSGAPQGHPLSTIPDDRGEFPPAEKRKTTKRYSFPVDGELPPELKVALGQKLQIGALEVEPVKVEARPLSLVGESTRGQTEKLRPTRNQALVLSVRIRNTSDDIALHPMDPAFNRKVKGSDTPATGLVVGKQTFWGGAIEWPFRQGVQRFYEQAQEADATPLKPQESREYVVFTDVVPNVIKAAKQATDPMLWRVQIRRGLIEYEGKEVPVTAIIGVEFKQDDVKGLN